MVGMDGNNATVNDNQRNTRRFALVLFVSGILLFAIHSMFLRTQEVNIHENWLVTLETTYIVKQSDSIISLQPPYESEYVRLTGRNVSHTGLRVMPSSRNIFTKRALRFRAIQQGTYLVDVEFTLQLSQAPQFHKRISSELDTTRRQYYLADNERLQLDHPVFEDKLIELGQNDIQREALLQEIFQYIHRFSGHAESAYRDGPTIIATRSGNHRERALAMVALCRKADIPARLVTGLELKDDVSANPDYWVEVYIDDRWTVFHPGLGYRDNLPVNFIAFDKYGEGIVSSSLKGSSANSVDHVFNTDITVERMPVTIGSPDNTRKEWYQVLIMDRLPADTREQLSLLMLLPFGALLCSLIRQVGGIHSYGVFTPTILALAVTYAEMETTLLILMITLLLVYFGRPTFHQEMSRTPRLSIIFTLVATGMIFGVSVLDYFSIATEGYLVLLPIVIITSLIDRFFLAIESYGYHIAFIRLIWTFLLTLAVLPILLLDWLGVWILRYPEIHLLTLALLIFISTYPFGKHKLPPWLGILVEPEEKKIKKSSSKNKVRRKKPMPS